MLHLIASNRFEVLLNALHQHLDAQTQPSPLAFQRVIVPSLAVRRAITLHTAQRYGICINLEFAFLAQWLWQTMGQLIPGIAPQTPFDAKVLTWRIEQQFGDARAWMPQARLGPYLAASDEAMRFQLAQRTATLFEQYTTYRPDWLESWHRNTPLVPPGGDGASASIWRQDESWQRNLWRSITALLPTPGDNPAERFVARILENPSAAASALAGNIHVFALPSIAPQHVMLLRALAQVIDVHVYALNPCREYWFDIVSEKRRLRMQSQGRALHAEVGHPILAGWGQQTRAHWTTLDQQLDDTQDVQSHFVEPTGTHRLARLQRAILNLQSGVDPTTPRIDPSKAGLPGDTSIEVHVCHSLRRELEALQNRLLSMYAQPDPPSPDQILVVTPSIDDAAPMIDAVFGASGSTRHIAYTITGRSRALDGNVAETLMALIDLGGSRLQASQLLQWLSWPLVMQRLGWSSDDVQTADEWLQSAGMRWGLHAEHRAHFDLPADEHHTLADALDRLVLGHLMAPQDDALQGGAEGFDTNIDTSNEAIFLDKLPAGQATGARALILGTLAGLAGRLDAWRQSLAQPKTPTDWHLALLGAIDDFLAPSGDAEVEGLRALRAALSQWQHDTDDADFHRTVAAPVMRAALQTYLAASAPGGAPSGSLTFASITALRNLPYRVIAVVGLDGGAFPTQSPTLEFDLMLQAPRSGDRQTRQDDRNAMLDLLLAARDALWLSYTGRDIRSNVELPPSVLVSELIEALAEAEGLDAATMGQRVTTEHPLQPFAGELFAPGAPIQRRSHHSAYAQALLAASSTAPQIAPSVGLTDVVDGAFDHGLENHGDDQEGHDGSGSDTETDETRADNNARADALAAPLFAIPLSMPSTARRTIGLQDLKTCFANPAQHLLKQRLGIRLTPLDDAAHDDEPFELDARERTAVVTQLMPYALRGSDASTLMHRARAGTSFPSGSLGEPTLRHTVVAVQRQAETFLEGMRQATFAPAVPPRVLDVDVDGHRWQLTLHLNDVRSDGLHRLGASKLRAKDRVAAWIDHLALNALVEHRDAATTRWVAHDRVLTLSPLSDATQALAYLTTWVQAYASGMCMPLAFMPQSSWVAVSASAPSALDQAWQGKIGGDGHDAYVQLAWRGLPPLIRHPTFVPLAQSLLGPLRDAATGDGR